MLRRGRGHSKRSDRVSERDETRLDCSAGDRYRLLIDVKGHRDLYWTDPRQRYQTTWRTRHATSQDLSVHSVRVDQCPNGRKKFPEFKVRIPMQVSPDFATTYNSIGYSYVIWNWRRGERCDEVQIFDTFMADFGHIFSYDFTPLWTRYSHKVIIIINLGLRAVESDTPLTVCGSSWFCLLRSSSAVAHIPCTSPSLSGLSALAAILAS